MGNTPKRKPFVAGLVIAAVLCAGAWLVVASAPGGSDEITEEQYLAKLAEIVAEVDAEE